MVFLSGGGKAAVARWALMSAALAVTASRPFACRPPALSPERAQALHEGLLREKAAGHSQEALFVARKLLRSFPEDSVYLNRVAEVYRDLGNFKAESAAYELVLKLSPTPTEACPAIGRAYKKQGLLERALDADRRCLELEPSNIDLRLYYGLSLESAARHDEARRVFESILAFAPRYADAAIGLARLDLAQSRPAKALQRLRALGPAKRALPDAKDVEARAFEALEKSR